MICWQGIHLDPSIYLMDDESKSPQNTQDQVKEANPESVASDDNKTETDNNPSRISGSDNEFTKCEQHANSQEEIATNEVNKVSDDLEAIDIAGAAHDNKGQFVS